MGFNFGNFAGGVAKTWDSKAIGGAINQGMLNSDIQAANDKAEEDKAALEHLQKAQEKQAIRAQDDTMDAPQTIDAGSKKVSDDWIKKQQEASTNNRTQAIKDAYTKWKSPEAYNNYLKSEAEGSKASFEKLFTDTKMNLTKQFQLWDSGTPEGNQDMFAAAQKQGLIPEGATFDPKNMTMTAPGEDGKPVVTQITPDMISRTKDALQLNSLKGLYKLDPGQRKAISDMTVAENTEDARIESERLKPKLAKSADARGWQGLYHTIDMDNKNYALNVDKFNRGIFEDDRDYNYRTERDRVGDSQWQQGFDWKKDESNRNYNYRTERDRVGDSQWQQGFDWKKQQDNRQYGLAIDEASRKQIESNRKHDLAVAKDRREQESHEAAMKISAAEFARKNGVQPDQVEIKTIKGGELGDRSIIVDKKTGAPVQNIDTATGQTYPLGFNSAEEYQNLVDQVRKYIGPDGNLQEHWKNGVVYQGKRYKNLRELESALDGAISKAKAGGKAYKNNLRKARMEAATNTMQNVFNDQAIPTEY